MSIRWLAVSPVLLLPMAGTAQKQIVERGAQQYPVVNFKGNIAYRSNWDPGGPHFLRWLEDPWSSPEFLDGSGPAKPPDPGADGMFFAMNETRAFYFKFEEDASGAPQSMGFYSLGQRMEIPPYVGSPVGFDPVLYRTSKRHRWMTIGYAPSDNEQAQYDIAGEHIVYSRWLGPDPWDLDIFCTVIPNHC